MNTTYGGKLKKDRIKAITFLVITAVLWSMGGMLIKLVNWNPVAIAGMRSAIASVLIFFVLGGKVNFEITPIKIWGAAAYAGTVILFVSATKLTTAANAILLQYTAPIFVAVFSYYFLGEKVTWIDWITIFFVILGMVLFFIDSIGGGKFLGNILAILSGAAFAGLALLMRKQKNESPLESIFLGNVATAIIGIPFMFKSMPDAKSWLGLVILGVVQIGISYILYSIAIKNVTALEAVLIPVIEPILNPIWVFLTLGEVPGAWAVIGGIVVLFFITARCVIMAMRETRNGNGDG